MRVAGQAQRAEWEAGREAGQVGRRRARREAGRGAGGETGGGPEMFMGSGDWINRNLSHRVEAAVPVEDPALQARLKEILDLLLADNRQAWDLAPDGTWTQRTPAPGDPDRGTHQH